MMTPTKFVKMVLFYCISRSQDLEGVSKFNFLIIFHLHPQGTQRLYFVPCIFCISSLNVVQSKLLGLKITPPGGVFALFMQTINKV